MNHGGLAMQQRKRLVSSAQNERQRQTISVCLRTETVAELDRLAKGHSYDFQELFTGRI